MVLAVGQQTAPELGEEEESLAPHLWPGLEGSEGVSLTVPSHEAVSRAGTWPLEMWHHNQLC